MISPFKIFNFYIPAVFLFLFGCSATYGITDYSTKEEFIKDLNISARSSKLDITLTKDSSLIIPDDTVIRNDSILLNSPLYSVPLAEIWQVKITNHL